MIPDPAHDPTPEFRAHLEWQVASALRREARFAAPASSRVTGWRLAALVLAAFVVGSLLPVASAQVREAAERDRLLEAAASQQKLVEIRLELARAELAEVKRAYDVGMADRQQFLKAEAQLKAMEAQLAKVQLDMEEIRASSAPPREELDAPLVAGRDFVGERLRLQLKTAERELAAAERALHEARSRFEMGVIPVSGVLRADAERLTALAAMQRLRVLLDARAQTLKGSLSGADLAASVERQHLKIRMQQVEQQIAMTKARLDQMKSKVGIGLAAPIDVKRVEVELMEQQIELQTLMKQFVSISGGKD